MSHEAIVNLIVSWLPFLLLIVVWLLICGKTGMFRRGALSHNRYLEEILNETKRHNAVLEALLTKTDSHPSQVETDTKKHNA
ncbi:MAG TPA: hypothetical protein VGI32_10235 [Steroidobacteraceae bacterium]|jgi:hypothetical protein